VDEQFVLGVQLWSFGVSFLLRVLTRENVRLENFSQTFTNGGNSMV
jgi:hypothetical protein